MESPKMECRICGQEFTSIFFECQVAEYDPDTKEYSSTQNYVDICGECWEQHIEPLYDKTG